MVPMSIRVSPVSREFEEVEHITTKVMMQEYSDETEEQFIKEEYAPSIRRGVCLSK